MADETLTLHTKLAQIMYEAERIPKRGTAHAVMGGYKFVQVGDAADYIRRELGAKSITMLPTAIRIVGQVDRPTKSGGMMTTVDLVTTWTFTDGDSGESVSFESFGAGADGGDKYSGKASTSAMKYALLTAFLLSTGDDAELGHDEASSRRPPPAGATVAPPVVHREEITGILSIGEANQSDGKLRETPDGWALGFNLTTGPRQWVRVLAEADLALALAARSGDVRAGLALKVYGPIVKVEDKVGDRIIRYQRITAEKIIADTWELPSAEAPSVALFDDADLDAALERVP